ncbi:MAG: YihY/virulence factor BrkB family protein [Turicibacter sp.]|nr:YihY/virulence factor BrkB family protein [Turicibacter sp.]
METIFSFKFIKSLWAQLAQRQIKVLPETIAFNLVMAMAPLLVVMVQIFTYFSIQSDLIQRLLATYVQNQEIIDFLQPLLDRAEHPTTGLFGIILTSIPFLWSISKGLYGISSAANITYRVPLMRFAIIERIVSFFLVCSLIVIMIAMLVVTIFGRQILSILLNYHHWDFPDNWEFLFNMAGTLVAFVSYVFFFQLLYYLAPTMRIRFTQAMPGAFVTATGWTLTSSVFSIYVNRIANYSIYGSLATIVILLFWLYLLGYTITLGLQVNYLLLRDYYGGVHYHPRLTFGSRKITRWTGYVQRKPLALDKKNS